jgi:dimethylhistidine N-methyltransferase
MIVEALRGRRRPIGIHLIDISPAALEQSEKTLGRLGYVSVVGHRATYEEGLRRAAAQRSPASPLLVLFLGSNVGNFDPPAAQGFLQEIRRALRPGDALLLGADLDKAEEILLPAYDDALGVTAAFNLNLLVRINRELGGAFDLAAFRHRARYDREKGRIEMHLESLRGQTVPIRALGIEIPFAAGETIHTESSYKFRPGQVAELAAATRFELRRTWTDSGRRFGSHLLVAFDKSGRSA